MQDDATQLPALSALLDRLAERVVQRSIVGVLVFDASFLDIWEHRVGAEAFETLLSTFGTAARQMSGQHLRHDDIVCRNAPGGDSILVFLTPPRAEDAPDFADIAVRTRSHAKATLPDADPFEPEIIDRVEAGSALIVGRDSVDPRRQIHRAIRRAREHIHQQRQEHVRQTHQLVGSVIAHEGIETRYQPIVHLDSSRTLGFEALSKPTDDFAEQLGAPLFSAAAEVELQAELDQLCRQLSVERRPALDSETRLFVNCLPATFYEPTDRLDELLDRWIGDGLAPNQLIFEINENISQAEADRILPTIRRLRQRGFQFALDDMGIGMTNLRLLAELEPTYIKMDLSLTQGIGDNIRKKALASYLLDLAEKSNARLIAEGIETRRELETVVELGVPYGQGHLIGRPCQFDHRD